MSRVSGLCPEFWRSTNEQQKDKSYSELADAQIYERNTSVFRFYKLLQKIYLQLLRPYHSSHSSNLEECPLELKCYLPFGLWELEDGIYNNTDFSILGLRSTVNSGDRHFWSSTSSNPINISERRSLSNCLLLKDLQHSRIKLQCS